MMRKIYVFLRDRIYHACMAYIAALAYGFPSRHLTVVGVTGTKGKSTVVELLAHILKVSGKKIVVSSSVTNDASGATMPRCFTLQRLLARGARNGATHAVIEVTSQGVSQNRHLFIQWAVAVCTNLSPEHIEAHGSFEKYRAAKVSFFSYAAKNSRAVFIVNHDDAHKKYFIDAARGHQVVEYSVSDFPSRLPGAFNAYNVGAACAVAEVLGIPDDTIRRAVADFPGVRGRMEYIQREPFAVVVDYAVTPDSLRSVYHILTSSLRGGSKTDEAISEIATPATVVGARNDEKGKLICVFGCTGGGRDKGKRPIMGAIASEACDIVILTDDDSYDEKTLDIIYDIEKGFLPNVILTKEYYKIPDRGEAIRKAIALARPGDTVIITGKGGDRWLRMARGKKIPWSDQDVAREALKKF